MCTLPAYEIQPYFSQQFSVVLLIEPRCLRLYFSIKISGEMGNSQGFIGEYSDMGACQGDHAENGIVGDATTNAAGEPH